jgi:PncC family amidohydrolase
MQRAPGGGVVRADEVGRLLVRDSLTLAVAESCTGGGLAQAITDVPGSSGYFLGGVVSYSNEAKVALLGVDGKTIDAEGAVSEEVSVMMAEGARRRFGADIGVGITGIAGPSGGTPEKPVGLVFVAVKSSERSVCTRNVFSGSRSEVRAGAVERALEMLSEFLG